MSSPATLPFASLAVPTSAPISWVKSGQSQTRTTRVFSLVRVSLLPSALSVGPRKVKLSQRTSSTNVSVTDSLTVTPTAHLRQSWPCRLPYWLFLVLGTPQGCQPHPEVSKVSGLFSSSYSTVSTRQGEIHAVLQQL